MGSSSTAHLGTLLLAGVTLTALLHTASAAAACGLEPTVIYVAKGDKKRVQFWNTDSAATSPDRLEVDVTGEQELGSGQQPLPDLSLQPAAALIAAGVQEVTSGDQEVTGSAEVMSPGVTQPPAPLVVTPSDPEATTFAPLYDAKPHIVLPEAPEQVDVVLSIVSLEDSGEELPDGHADPWIHQRDPLDTSEGSGDAEESMPKTPEDGEFLPQPDPFDLIAMADYDAIAADESSSELEGSGNSKEALPASAIVQFNKYQEIRLPSHDDVEASGDAMVSDDDAAPVNGLDRLITVAGFSGDQVLLDWTPDEGQGPEWTLSGEQSADFIAEGSGNVEELPRAPAVSNSLPSVSISVPDSDAVSVQSETAEVSVFDSESPSYSVSVSVQDTDSVAESTADDPVSVSLGSPLSVSVADESAASLAVLEPLLELQNDVVTDELLPMVQLQPQASSIHALFASLPLGRPHVQDTPEVTVPDSAIADVKTAGFAHDGATAAEEPHRQVESSPGDVSQLDRLLLVQGLASGNRVILEHIPDPPAETGSGQGADDDDTLFLEDASESSGQEMDATVEASGGAADAVNYQNPEAHKKEETWATREAEIVGSSDELSPSELTPQQQPVAVAAVKDAEQAANAVQVEAIGAEEEQLPVAEVEAIPHMSEEEKAADSADAEAIKSEAELVEVTAEEGSGDLEQGSSDKEDYPPSVTTLDRETLLNRIYRIIHGNSTPSRFAAGSRPSWPGFRRPLPAPAQPPTERVAEVGQASHQQLYGDSGEEAVAAPQQPHPFWQRQRLQAEQEMQQRRRRRARRSSGSGDTAPVSVDKTEQQQTAFDAADSIRNADDQLFRFIRSQPYPFLTALMHGWPRARSVSARSAVDCEWQIKTEPHLYLLVTLNNLSAPYTIDCDGAYIEVERERDGFEARWCGNRIKQSGSRPHMVFARGEVRIAVFNDGNTTELPTGFEADVEVVDLLDARQYSTFRRSGLNFRRLILDPVLPLA